MRITKDVAEETAEKMTAKKSLELLEMRNSFSEKVRNLIGEINYFESSFSSILLS